MNTQTSIKNILTLAALALILLLSACSPLKYKTQESDIQDVAGKIAGYTLPEGYSEQFAVELMDYQLISLVGPTPSCHIYLVQAPTDADVDIAALQEQARNMDGNKREDSYSDVQIVEQRSTVIRGQDVTMLVGEGVNSENLPYREVTALFDGKTGPALVSIASPVSEWDWTMVDEFLASIE
ncbi:MAG: hypothetical protein EHM70_09890 [Chloroflexota bacterium]|nr:MAG: hypothetical protein EHM70_09890 [Chloroflexota bacterium]